MHTMEDDSVLKRNGILLCAATWMDHEDIMFSEINQSQKSNAV